MKSRAVIAGATGLIGSNLAEYLLLKGWEVYGVARKLAGFQEYQPTLGSFLDLFARLRRGRIIPA